MKPGVLITGGVGLLGSSWARQISKRYHVTICRHKQSISIDNVFSLRVNLDSIDDIMLAIRTTQSSIVIHCAAMTNVEACEHDPIEAYHVNVNIARNVAIACARLCIKLVHISTDHLFSGKHSMIDELCFVSPVNNYAKTKAFAENFVQEESPTALILRTNFFGWGLSYRKSFSDYIINSLRSDKEISLFSDVYFTPILMELLISAAHELIEADACGIFNVVGDERLSKYDFGYRLAVFLNLNTSLIKVSLLSNRGDLVPRPLDLSLDNRKICSVVGHRIGDIDFQFARLKAQENLTRD